MRSSTARPLWGGGRCALGCARWCCVGTVRGLGSLPRSVVAGRLGPLAGTPTDQHSDRPPLTTDQWPPKVQRTGVQQVTCECPRETRAPPPPPPVCRPTARTATRNSPHLYGPLCTKNQNIAQNKTSPPAGWNAIWRSRNSLLITRGRP